jgi:hypothetical protein
MNFKLRIFTGIILTTIFSLSYGQNRISVNIEEFSSLSVSGRIDLELIPSESKEISITSLNGNPDDVNIEFKNGNLKIWIRPAITKDDEINIKLPYKKLSQIEAAAGALINSARDLESEILDLKASSGGKIELSIQSNELTAKVTQVSDIVLYGNVVSQKVTVNTGGNYLAYDLKAQDTYIKVSSGSQGKVTASRIIEAVLTLKHLWVGKLPHLKPNPMRISIELIRLISPPQFSCRMER